MDTNTYQATTAETTTTTTQSEGPGVGLDREFPKTPNGIILIGATVSSLIMSICGSVYPWSYSAGGFVASIGWIAFIGTGILTLTYLFRVLPKIPGPIGLVVLIYLGILVAATLLAFILSAVNAGEFGAAIASAIFAVPTLALHAVFGFFMFQKYRSNGSGFHRSECGYTYSSSQQTQQYNEP